MESPCRGVCKISEATGWCYGCMRTLKEIEEWGRMGSERRVKVLEEAVGRLRKCNES